VECRDAPFVVSDRRSGIGMAANWAFGAKRPPNLPADDSQADFGALYPTLASTKSGHAEMMG
jgi:hypothetical protein